MKCSQTKFSPWNLYNNHHFAQLLTITLNAQVKEANVDLDVVEPEVQDFSVFRGNSGVSSFLIGFFLLTFGPFVLRMDCTTLESIQSIYILLTQSESRVLRKYLWGNKQKYFLIKVQNIVEGYSKQF